MSYELDLFMPTIEEKNGTCKVVMCVLFKSSVTAAFRNIYRCSKPEVYTHHIIQS